MVNLQNLYVLYCIYICFENSFIYKEDIDMIKNVAPKNNGKRPRIKRVKLFVGARCNCKMESQIVSLNELDPHHLI